MVQIIKEIRAVRVSVQLIETGVAVLSLLAEGGERYSIFLSPEEFQNLARQTKRETERVNILNQKN